MMSEEILSENDKTHFPTHQIKSARYTVTHWSMHLIIAGSFIRALRLSCTFEVFSKVAEYMYSIMFSYNVDRHAM